MPLKLTKTIKQAIPDIRKPLHAYLAGFSPGRPATKLHASDITKQDPEFCPRAHALRAMAKTLPNEFATTADRVVWRLGLELQEAATQWYADIGMAVGDWKCRHCSQWYRFMKRPKFCTVEGCGHKEFKYEEVRAFSPVTLASCGLDVLLDVDRPKLAIVEIKTLEKDEFKKLVAPKAEHKLRTCLYMQTVAEATAAGEDHRMAQIESEYAYVMYITKGGWGQMDPEIATWGFKDGAFSPFKVYPIPRNDEIVLPYRNRALAYKAWKDGKGLPDRTCTNSFQPEAKKCAKMVECFSGKYQ